MTSTITMSQAQLQRFEVLSQLNSKQIKGQEASEKLGLSVRHIRRLKRNIQDKGAQSLVHGNRGKSSKRKVSDEVKEKVRVLLTTTYKGYGPTFASEKLTERDDIHVSDEWLRLFLTEEKIWTPKTRGQANINHIWRARMELRGAMEQFDGSYHHWIEGLDEEQCLLLAIDDATGHITKAYFDTNEGIVPVFTFWRDYAKEYDHFPRRIYVDKFSTYKINHKNAVDNPDTITQFERVLKTLGVELVCAHSPQAKGRVERVFGTLQDRLVKEMTLVGVTNRSEANAFLLAYIPKFNEQFGVKAYKDGDAYLPILPTTTLSEVFATHHSRVVGNDFTVRFENGWYQISKEQSVTVRPRDTVVMERRLDLSVHMRLTRSNTYLNVTQLPVRPERTKLVAFIAGKKVKTVPVPASNHPWRNHANKFEKTPA